MTEMIMQLRKKFKSLNNPLCHMVLMTALFLLSLNAWSQTDPIGTVLTSSGQVIAESNGSTRSLKRRDSVFVGDTISAANNSRVRFKLTDDSTYVVQENSSFTIEKYNYNGEQDGSEIADFYFSEGVMEFVSGYIGKQDQTKFRIDTDFAAIGLRGSGGIITTGSSSTQVFVTLGQLTAVSKGGELFVMNNGQTTILDSNGETETEQGNSTGAEQTMSTDGDDISAEDGDADEGEPAEEAEEEQEAEQEEQEQEQEQTSEDVQENEEIAADEPEEVEDSAAEQNADAGSDSDAGATAEAQVSAAEIYAELLPDSVEATQDDLAEALNEAVEAYPVLYAELVNVAIDAGLEPPNAALTATEALGGAGSISENVLTEIFVVSTQGLTDTAQVEAALAIVGAPPLDATPTTTSNIGVNSDSVGTSAPSNTASAPVSSASPAQ